MTVKLRNLAVKGLGLHENDGYSSLDLEALYWWPGGQFTTIKPSAEAVHRAPTSTCNPLKFEYRLTAIQDWSLIDT